MSLKCLIVDDEHLARELINMFCSRLPNLKVVGTCKNAIEAIHFLAENQVDLIFLDIQMPDLSGIDLVKTLKVKPAIIFTTAYSDYAVEGFELDVTDYLVKPFSFERFIKAVNKVKSPSEPETLVKEAEFMIVKADHKLYKVMFKEIKYIEGLREYVAYHLKDKKIVALASLKKLEEELPTNFIRIHKSFIINADLIESISGNEIELGTVKLPIGKSYKEEVMKLF
jgi:DNA-binding LytR/AlgR family response regulator